MNFETFVALATVNMSWADAAELGDDKLPPIPISWFKNNETVKVWKEPDWTVVRRRPSEESTRIPLVARRIIKREIVKLWNREIVKPWNIKVI